MCACTCTFRVYIYRMIQLNPALAAHTFSSLTHPTVAPEVNTDQKTVVLPDPQHSPAEEDYFSERHTQAQVNVDDITDVDEVFDRMDKKILMAVLGPTNIR